MNQKSKIIFFNPYADRQTKGAARRIEFLSSVIQKKNRKVEIIIKEDYHQKTFSIYEDLFLKMGFCRLAYFFAVLRLARDPNVVIVTEVIFVPTWLDNVILTIHDMKAFDRRASRGGKIRSLAYKIFAHLATKIVVVSEVVKNDVIKYCDVHESRIHVIYNSLSNKRINIAQRSRTDVKRYDFVYVSSFARHKRHVMLVDSAPVGARICFVGRDLGALDDVYAHISARADEISVDIFNDVCSDEDLFELISSAHCGVFPSIFEGFGIPLLEYAAAGLYVMSSDIPVFREISSCVDCFVSADDSAAWHNSMSNYMNTYAKGKFNLENFIHNSDYSEDVIGREFISIVDSLL